MAHQIIKRPDGSYAVWSTGVDDFIIVDATAAQLEVYYGDRAYQDAARDVQEIIDKLNNGDKPYHQFTLTWEEMLQKKASKDV